MPRNHPNTNTPIAMKIHFDASRYLPFCFVFLLLIPGATSYGFAQKKKDQHLKKTENDEGVLELDEQELFNEDQPNLRFELSDEEAKLAKEEEKQSKRRKTSKKKRIYFDIKTKGGFTKTGSSSITVEVFRMIEDSYLIKDPYQKEIYYYDTKAKRIKQDSYDDFRAKVKKGLSAYLLHGQYQKYRDQELREEGYYYKGLKHDRWTELNSKGVLLEKITFHLGYPESAQITYYDAAEKKPKEIIPVVYDRKEGKYYRFHENGVLAESGDYQNNHKVGTWREWHENRARKQDTQYPQKWWDEKEPILLRKWTEKGVMTYDIDRGGEIK